MQFVQLDIVQDFIHGKLWKKWTEETGGGDISFSIGSTLSNDSSCRPTVKASADPGGYSRNGCSSYRSRRDDNNDGRREHLVDMSDLVGEVIVQIEKISERRISMKKKKMT
eukprot:scaffold350542_cov129-Cyclotella_meneghiniana.AAC.1